jgi:hypothetical protein
MDTRGYKKSKLKSMNKCMSNIEKQSIEREGKTVIFHTIFFIKQSTPHHFNYHTTAFVVYFLVHELHPHDEEKKSLNFLL